MATKLKIVNSALSKLGARALTSLNDDTKNGHLARDTFDEHRDAFLESHNWNFATKRLSLPALATAPVFEYDHAYQLPSDSLKPLFVNGQDATSKFWEVEGRTIVSNISGPIDLKYIYRNEDYGDYPATAAEALSAKLAREWAQRVTGTDSTEEAKAKLEREAAAIAKTADGQQGTPARVEASRWILSRF